MFGKTKHIFMNSYGDMGSSGDGKGCSLVGGYYIKKFYLFGIIPITLKTTYHEYNNGEYESALRDFELDRVINESPKVIYERIILPNV